MNLDAGRCYLVSRCRHSSDAMDAGLKVVSSCMLSRWGVMTVIRSYPDGELTVICFVVRGVMEITLGCVEETCIKVHDIQRYSCPRETKHPPIYPHHFPPEKPEQIQDALPNPRPPPPAPHGRPSPRHLWQILPNMGLVRPPPPLPSLLTTTTNTN